MSAATGFAIVPRHVLGGKGYIAPSDKTTMAFIGLGGQGQINLDNLLQIKAVQAVAVCDVHREGDGYISSNWDRGNIKKTGGYEPARRRVNAFYADQKAQGSYQDCRTYSDYRELMDREDVDAVMIAVPDHSHAVITMAALRQGKHVYCEKPLTYSVEEARLITEAARKAQVATQLGNHGQASEEARIVQEFLLDGAIGPVHEVHIAWNRKRFWDPPSSGYRPTETPPIPDGLDWDLWLGPAPARPYHPAYHPWSWRDWRDFGTSPLGDMGCHLLSTVFKALKLKYPTSIEADCVERGPEVHPRKFRVKYEFPAREGMPPITLTWHDEGYDPPRLPGFEPGQKIRGPVYVGEDGTLMGHRLVPESAMKAYGRPPRLLPRSPGQYQEWVDACRGGPAAGSDFVKHSGILTETPLLGNIAMRFGKKLHWDGPNLRFTNSEEANQYLHRRYRKGWVLS